MLGVESETKVRKYRKKPIEIEAVRWTGANIVDVLGFAGESLIHKYKHGVPNLSIKTLEGMMRVSIGDYIIKGVRGEFYACKPDVFEKTYCSDVDLDSGVDWSKVPLDTKIYVKDYEIDKWTPRYFAKYENGKVYAWSGGGTSWSCGESNMHWKYAKLAEVE